MTAVQIPGAKGPMDFLDWIPGFQQNVESIETKEETTMSPRLYVLEL